MHWYEYLIIAAAVAFVVFVVIRQIVRKKQGKTGCDCCDGNCAACIKARRAEHDVKNDDRPASQQH